MSNQTGISLRPSTFTAGGSLIDDVDVTFTRLRFGYGYGESKGNADADGAVTLQTTMVDSDGNEHLGFYSVGNGFVPSEGGSAEENGKMLVAVGEKTGMNGGSNAALLITSLINAGLPEDLLDTGDVSKVEGTKAHVNRVPAPKRTNLPKRQGPNADREVTVLLITTIISLPGEKPKAGTKGPQAVAKPGAAAAKPAAPVADGLTDELTMELMGLFAEAGVSSMKKVDIVKGLFKSIDNGNGNKKAIIGLAGKEDVLKSLEGFTFSGTELTQD